MSEEYRDNMFACGDSGEDFIKWYCNTYKIECFLPKTKEEAIKTGVDLIMNGTPTDVKNTLEIFLGNYRLDNYKRNDTADRFLARMPFNTVCKAIDYCILDIDPVNKSNKVVYHGRIDDYLATKYFKGDEALSDAYQVLLKYHKKSFSELGFSGTDQFFFKMKSELKKFVHDNIKINYTSISIKDYYPDVNELSIKMVTEEDDLKVKARKSWWKNRK